jgi:hypothetical protein
MLVGATTSIGLVGVQWVDIGVIIRATASITTQLI